MVIEHSVRRADDGLAIPLWIEGQADAGLKIVLVGLNSLLQTQHVVCGESQALRCLELWRELDVVTETVVQRDVGTNPPRILPINAERLVRERIAWAAQALNEVARQACAVGLNRGENRKGEVLRRNRWETQRCGAERSEVVNAAVVHREDGIQRQVVEVDAEFGVVVSDAPREVVSELITLLGALDVRVGFTSKIGEARDVDCRVGAAWNRLVVEVGESAPRVLEAELVHLVVADGPRVLEGAGDIAIGLF